MFSEEEQKLFPVKQNDKWGFVAATGSIIAHPQYDEVDQFFGGLAKVYRGDSFGYIDTKGTLIWSLSR